MTVGRWAFAVALVAMVGALGHCVVRAGSGEGPVPMDPVERLRTAPLDGDAFGDLAAGKGASGDAGTARALHEIAVRRDPRDLRARGSLADLHLRAGDYPEAFRQLDVILRLSPHARSTLPPQMARWAGDPAFADALVAVLREDPAWRGVMVAALRADIDGPGAGVVFTALSQSGDLSDSEVSDWLDSLMQAGNWGLAYSYWATGLGLEPGTPLPMLYNGDFETPPTQRGFDWRTGRRPGTYTEFVPTDGAKGNAAHIVFLGRPVDGASLEQALALPPGRYRVSMRAKAASLRSDQGLHWVVACDGQGVPRATGERLEGNFGWRNTALEFEVPARGCPGQWLRVDNPAPRGSARIVSGELWFDRLALRPLGGPAAGAEDR